MDNLCQQWGQSPTAILAEPAARLFSILRSRQAAPEPGQAVALDEDDMTRLYLIDLAETAIGK